MEAILCECVAISATRIYVQIEREIVTDPCDNRLIRCNNCIQLLSCICHILAVISDTFELAACILDVIADVTYCVIQACMQAQTHLELERHPTPADYGPVTSQPKGNVV